MSDQAERGPVVIVLAAGIGARMKSSRSKLLHTLGGHSLLRHVLDAVEQVPSDQLVVVVGFQQDLVSAQLAEFAPGAQVVVQESPDGTLAALRLALAVVDGLAPTTPVVVACADMPLLAGATMAAIVEAHRGDNNSATVLTSAMMETASPMWPPDPEAGLYVFNYQTLTEELDDVADPVGGGLADVVAAAAASGQQVGDFVVQDVWQTRGCDDRVQLAALGVEYNRRLVERWMRAGVTVVDPATTWIEADVDLAADVTLLPGTMLAGATSVATGAVIGPETTVKDSEVGAGAAITRSTVELSVIGEAVTVGPYARLRPGTQIGAKGVVGTFVETKNAKLGEGARLGHLTYCGDATLGDGADVGAGVVFANWDTTNRSHTDVGAGAVIGAGSLIVPPLRIADSAVVPPGASVEADDEQPRRSRLGDETDPAKRGLEEDK